MAKWNLLCLKFVILVGSASWSSISVSAKVSFEIPNRFQGFWHQKDVPCNVEDDERYDIRKNEIIEYEVDTYVRWLRAKGNRLYVIVDEGFESKLKRRKIDFVVAADGQSMLVDKIAYIRCRGPSHS